MAQQLVMSGRLRWIDQAASPEAASACSRSPATAAQYSHQVGAQQDHVSAQQNGPTSALAPLSLLQKPPLRAVTAAHSLLRAGSAHRPTRPAALSAYKEQRAGRGTPPLPLTEVADGLQIGCYRRRVRLLSV